jgi:flavodoxin
VLFGSNLGTAEGIAHRIADDARSRGFAATVGTLDEHADALPRQGAAIIITASYNGQRPAQPSRRAVTFRMERAVHLPPRAVARPSSSIRRRS